MIEATDKWHPKNWPCDSCDAKPGEWCKSKFGRVIKGFERQHSNRHKKANAHVYGR